MAKVSRATSEGGEAPPKKSSRPEWIYFISYRWWNHNEPGQGFGNREYAAPDGIVTIEHIRQIEELIKEELGCTQVVVISYLYLRHASVKPVAVPEAAEARAEVAA